MLEDAGVDFRASFQFQYKNRDVRIGLFGREFDLELVDAELEAREDEGLGARTAALRQCLETLTENARNIVRLRFFEGLRSDQVAEKLDRKPDAVYKALQRIYDSLGDCIRRKLIQIETGGLKP